MPEDEPGLPSGNILVYPHKKWMNYGPSLVYVAYLMKQQLIPRLPASHSDSSSNHILAFTQCS
jgi:hypothetical protein